MNTLIRSALCGLLLVSLCSCTTGGQIINQTEQIWLAFHGKNDQDSHLLVLRKPNVYQKCFADLGGNMCSVDTIYTDLDIAMIDLKSSETKRFNIRFDDLTKTAIRLFDNPKLESTEVASLGGSSGDWVCLQIYAFEPSNYLENYQPQTFIYAVNLDNNKPKSWIAMPDQVDDKMTDDQGHFIPVNLRPKSLFADETSHDFGCLMLNRSFGNEQYGSNPNSSNSMLEIKSQSKPQWTATYHSSTVKNDGKGWTDVEYIELVHANGKVKRLNTSSWLFTH